MKVIKGTPNKTIKVGEYFIGIQSQYVHRFKRRTYAYKINNLQWSPYLTLQKINEYLAPYGLKLRGGK